MESSDCSQHQILNISKDEWEQPPSDQYVKSIKELSIEELYDNYNPGPTLPDGTTNFECHCVAPLIGSPCGFAFRESMMCRDRKTREELDSGACADEFMAVVNCLMKTGCFESFNDFTTDGEAEEPQKK